MADSLWRGVQEKKRLSEDESERIIRNDVLSFWLREEEEEEVKGVG